ncbi:MAG: VanW family protein [bacterium]|nr:VanW family protein [bacterium]
MFRSPSFRTLISRLIIAGAVVLIGFPLGMLAYLRTLAPPPPVPVKNIASLVEQSSSHDTTIIVGNKKFVIKKGTVTNWTEPYIRNYTGEEDVRFTKGLGDYVSDLAKSSGRIPIDAKFTINDGKAVILTPARNGQELDIPTATTELRQGLLANKSEIELTLEITEPGITEEKISSLGINDRLAIGESNFTGSTTARIQNIKVSSKKYNGFIIKPNETFSFNTILGDVVASTGYAPEKVIKNGQIMYEYGGGICQVSTTLFRAAIMAGFPIVERRPHSFPVQYYNPQGFDATIYPGSSDLRFTNNTPGPVLVQTHITGKTLIFEIYGKSDGRTVTMNGPYQYDIQPDGALKAYFTRTISFADGASTSKTFYSNYKSPSLYPTEPNPYQ